MKRIICIFLAVYFFGNVYSHEQSQKPHEKLNEAEFQKIFHRTRRDVPDYKFVNIDTKHEHRAKREVRPVVFQVDNQKVQLNLRPSTHYVFTNYIPVWVVETRAGRSYNYRALNDEEKNINGIFYEDVEKMATLLAYYKDRHIYYDGIFGESRECKVVRAVPENWWRTPGAKENQNHFVYSVKQTANGVEAEEHDHNNNYYGEQLDKPLDRFIVKLLVIVDYSLFQTLGKNIQETIQYVATFWNAVNLKYSKLDDPKIEIMVTGLIISKDISALEYVYRSRNVTDMDKCNYLDMLRRGSDYFKSDEFKKATDFTNYDSTFTMMKLNTRPVVGSAYLANICAKDLNVGYTNDDGSYSGVMPATHELGHLLGLGHDSTEGNGCNGYMDDDHMAIMAPFVGNVREFVWSQCSKRGLKKFASSKRAACLKDYYHYDY